MIREVPYGDVLLELEKGLYEHDQRVCDGADPYSYTDEHFRASLKIFFSAMLWKMLVHAESEGVSDESKVALAEMLGNELRYIIFKFSNVDTHKL